MKPFPLILTMMLAGLVPVLAWAQTPTPTPQSGTVTGPNATPPPGPGGHRGGGGGMMGVRMLMNGITLTDSQQQQINQLMTQFRQGHQPGSPPDPQARQALMTSVENVLTPDQRTQFENNMAQMRANFQNRRQQNGGLPGGPFTPDMSPSPAPSPS